MLCERCKEKEATMTLTKVINNKKTVTHLCADCAREMGTVIPSPIDGISSILSGLMGLDNLWNAGNHQSIGTEKKCPACGMTQEDITREGKFGCAECYITFIDQVRPLLRKIHGNCLHHGSTPEIGEKETQSPKIEESKNAPKEDRLSVLQNRMKDAIGREDFEEAAKIRDEIKELQKGDKN